MWNPFRCCARPRQEGGASEAPKPAKVTPQKADVLIISTSCTADATLAQSIKDGLEERNISVNILYDATDNDAKVEETQCCVYVASKDAAMKNIGLGIISLADISNKLIVVAAESQKDELIKEFEAGMRMTLHKLQWIIFEVDPAPQIKTIVKRIEEHMSPAAPTTQDLIVNRPPLALTANCLDVSDTVTDGPFCLQEREASFTSDAPPSRPGFDAAPGGPTAGGGALSQNNIYPINSLSLSQSNWTIRVRVVSKTPIRPWSKSKGEGRVFTVDLVDKSGEIRASGFNTVADKFHALFELGKVYYVSRGKLKPANKQFNTTNNEYELSLNEDTEVELCTDATLDSSIPTIQYNFKDIATIESVEPNTIIDVIGVCSDAGKVTSFVNKKTNCKNSKREIYLVDCSDRVVACTLWGTEAEEFDGSQFPVVAVKGAKVSDFRGRSLSTTMNSVVVVNPDIKEAHQLRGWFDSVGKNQYAP